MLADLRGMQRRRNRRGGGGGGGGGAEGAIATLLQYLLDHI